LSLDISFFRELNKIQSFDGFVEYIGSYMETCYKVSNFFFFIHDPNESKVELSATYKIQPDKLKTMNLPIGSSYTLSDSFSPFLKKSVEKKHSYYFRVSSYKPGSAIEADMLSILGGSYHIVVPICNQNEVQYIMYASIPKQVEKIYQVKMEIANLLEIVSVYFVNFFLKEETVRLKEKTESLLYDILPQEVALELSKQGYVDPVYLDNVSILFTDFVGFTKSSATMDPYDLVSLLDGCFFQFDEIAKKYHIERLKTIGDSYMCAGGVPVKNATHPFDICLMALEILSFVNMLRMVSVEENPFWQVRIGIHCGPVVAGLIGKTKYAYDIWGSSVNVASRMESFGLPGTINISKNINDRVSEFFLTEHRGNIEGKNKEKYDMYLLHRIQPEYSLDAEGIYPNQKFLLYLQSVS
jgi:class 3 adenylate cyclase